MIVVDAFTGDVDVDGATVGRIDLYAEDDLIADQVTRIAGGVDVCVTRACLMGGSLCVSKAGRVVETLPVLEGRDFADVEDVANEALEEAGWIGAIDSPCWVRGSGRLTAVIDIEIKGGEK
jgi:hypothetical protein